MDEYEESILFLHCLCGSGLLQAVVTPEGLGLLCGKCNKSVVEITDLQGLINEVFEHGCECPDHKGKQ